ncbi:pantoate--beta-alanine ligase [Streptomyces sp. NPDC059740]|uniref:pantoate--beta-alanine ligase n=1 Tax=Streptomyces sp. NPDC059740 TaxID=3346926 RepID=UPI00365DC4A6
MTTRPDPRPEHHPTPADLAGTSSSARPAAGAAAPAAPRAATGQRRDTGPQPTADRPHLVRTAAELRALTRGTGPRVAVMTMGALHAGHAELVRAARERAGTDGQVVVTVFVNPLQFGAGEDLDRYPRTLDADLAVAAAAGADVVFAPPVEEVYPGGEPQVRISAGPMGEVLEGASRPGHFDGMLTVVAKLLHLCAPDVACYGEKDAQQLALITRMVRDLNFPVEIVGVPTVREEDGLALSSRNRYLDAAERRTALTLSKALFAAVDRLAAEAALRTRAAAGAGPEAAAARASGLAALGEDREAADALALAHAVTSPPRTAAVARAAAQSVLDEAAGLRPPLELDYLALVDPRDFTEVDEDHTGEAVLAVAARVGTTRLIDNVRLSLGARA